MKVRQEQSLLRLCRACAQRLGPKSVGMECCTASSKGVLQVSVISSQSGNVLSSAPQKFHYVHTTVGQGRQSMLAGHR